jgi:alkanesulfonate monooxygenase SsuD/methylene tetrahydromethanopterin reductase-like flavin-dependent oxidoreductase (luciferase family)
MRFPSPTTVAAFEWTDADRALVEDRVSTQFAGSPTTVAKHLRVLQDTTGADELLVTTITHAHADRVRSFELLAREWGLA